jgi:hypothetical protein
VDECLVDLILRHGVVAPALACIEKLSFLFRPVEHLSVDMKIVDDYVRALQALESLYSHKADIAGPCADEIDFALLYLRHSQILIEKSQKCNGIAQRTADQD